jgi:hypothetical protein
MEINSTAFIAAVAIGALAELITLNHPTRYEKATTVVTLLLVAFAVALLPGDGSWWAVAGLAVAKGGDIAGKLIHSVMVKVMVWLDSLEDDPEWLIHPDPQAEWQETSIQTSEKM